MFDNFLNLFDKNTKTNNIEIKIFNSIYNIEEDGKDLYENIKELYNNDKRNIKIDLIEVSENPNLVKEFHIKNSPTLIIVENNKIIYFQEKTFDWEDIILILKKKIPLKTQGKKWKI